MDKEGLFNFMIERVKEAGSKTGYDLPQAFGQWFINMFFQNPQGILVSDGSRDGKIDLYCTTHNDKIVRHHVLNTKFTRQFNKLAPRTFYDEVRAFWRAFDDKDAWEAYLEKRVKPELRPGYRTLFESYKAGTAELFFVTNHRRNNPHYEQVKNAPVRMFHLDDLLQFLNDDLDAAMPRTKDITLTKIDDVLSAGKDDIGVVTSIVFARLIDFIKYMREDKHGLLFARNVREPLGNSPVNKRIRETFQDSPKEFAFSNNGITLLCDKHIHDPGAEDLMLENPRVVNGSQTLHSVRDVPNPSHDARVMVRIVEIPPPAGVELSALRKKRKEIINKISIRSNQQNPIKKWNLVANDDFQLDLFRHFRRNDLYYERKDKEWSNRSRLLKSLGIKKGPSIKRLTQLMASYHWDKQKLGPALAKLSVGELFDGVAYEGIKRTTPELAYQIYLVGEMTGDSYRQLSQRVKYIKNMKGHIDLTLFSMVAKVLWEIGASWGKGEFTNVLDKLCWYDWDIRRSDWDKLVKSCVIKIHEQYKKEKALQRREGNTLTYNNFFKTQSYVGKILDARVSGHLGKLARQILKH